MLRCYRRSGKASLLLGLIQATPILFVLWIMATSIPHFKYFFLAILCTPLIVFIWAGIVAIFKGRNI